MDATSAQLPFPVQAKNQPALKKSDSRESGSAESVHDGPSFRETLESESTREARDQVEAQERVESVPTQAERQSSQADGSGEQRPQSETQDAAHSDESHSGRESDQTRQTQEGVVAQDNESTSNTANPNESALANLNQVDNLIALAAETLQVDGNSDGTADSVLTIEGEGSAVVAQDPLVDQAATLVPTSIQSQGAETADIESLVSAANPGGPAAPTETVQAEAVLANANQVVQGIRNNADAANPSEATVDSGPTGSSGNAATSRLLNETLVQPAPGNPSEPVNAANPGLVSEAATEALDQLNRIAQMGEPEAPADNDAATFADGLAIEQASDSEGATPNASEVLAQLNGNPNASSNTTSADANVVVNEESSQVGSAGGQTATNDAGNQGSWQGQTSDGGTGSAEPELSPIAFREMGVAPAANANRASAFEAMMRASDTGRVQATGQTVSVLTQLVENMGSEPVRVATVELQPIELGKLTIRIEQTGDSISATILASESSTSDLLNGQKSNLQDALADLGYEDASVDVSRGEKEEQSGREQNKSGREVTFAGGESSEATPGERIYNSNSGVDIVV